MKSLGDIIRTMVKHAIENGNEVDALLRNLACMHKGKTSIAEFKVGELEELVAEIKRKLTSSYILNTSGRMPELKAINKRTRVKFFIHDETGADALRITLVDGASKIGASKRGARTFNDGVQAVMTFNPDIIDLTPEQIVGAQAIIKQYRSHAASILGEGNDGKD